VPRVSYPRVFALALALLVVAYIGFSLWGLLNIWDSESPEKPRDPLSRNTAKQETLSGNVVIGGEALAVRPTEDKQPSVAVTLYLEKLIPSRRVIQAAIQVYGDHSMKSDIVSGRLLCRRYWGPQICYQIDNQIPVASTIPGDAEPTLKEEFRRAAASLQVQQDGQSTDIAIPIGLDRLLGPNDGVGDSDFAARVELRVVGDSNRYPNDRYLLPQTSLILWLPNDVHWKDPTKNAAHGGNYRANLPVRMSIGARPSMEDSVIRVIENAPEFDNIGLFYSSDTIGLMVSRAGTYRAFILAMALAPAMLLVVIAYQLWSWWKQGTPPPGPAQEVTAEVAAGLFAILPLRQVLVPSGIEGLTLVDYLLGLQLVLLIGLFVIRHALRIWTTEPSIDDRRGYM
jgi:hypothetical protein